MKKFLFAMVAVLALSFAANAQHAIGVRGVLDGGAELSYQQDLGSNRLEVDLGIHSGSHWSWFNLTGIYQWKGTISGPLGWYAGVGAQVGYYSWKNDWNQKDGDLDLGVGGQLGLEFVFPGAPIQLTLDWRPMFLILDASDRTWSSNDAALGLRYIF